MKKIVLLMPFLLCIMFLFGCLPDHYRVAPAGAMGDRLFEPTYETKYVVLKNNCDQSVMFSVSGFTDGWYKNEAHPADFFDDKNYKRADFQNAEEELILPTRRLRYVASVQVDDKSTAPFAVADDFRFTAHFTEKPNHTYTKKQFFSKSTYSDSFIATKVIPAGEKGTFLFISFCPRNDLTKEALE